MKSTQKMSLVTVLLVGITTATPVFAQGGHVNGPDLAGVSIPLAADNEIRMEKLQQAASTCYKQAASQVLQYILGRYVDLGPMRTNYSGYHTQLHSSVQDSPTSEMNQAGLKSLRVYDEFTSTYNPNSYTDNSELSYRPGDILSVPPKLDLKDYYFNLLIDVETEHASWTTFKTRYMYSKHESYNDPTQDYYSITLVADSLPVLTYKIVDHSIYGQLGELIRLDKYVGDIAFVNLSNMGYPLNAIPLRNEETEHGAVNPKVTLNFQTVIDCFKTELAR